MKKNPTGPAVITIIIALLLYNNFPFDEHWRWPLRFLFSSAAAGLIGVVGYWLMPEPMKED